MIRSEPLTGYAALDDASATYRVIYQSTSGVADRLNQPIGVSGIIAFPTAAAPDGGWPVISWAHGTVGSADKCAPSMDSDELGDPEEEDTGLGLLRKINKAPHGLLNAFLRQGWAVAMTDYEGLGTYGNHPFLLGDSEGRGILDIVPAARQLADQEVKQPVSGKYAIVGHSQGGQAALFGAHLADTYHPDTYTDTGTLVGVAALAPASNLKAGLLVAYQNLLFPNGDLGAFYPLFSNGVFGGDPGIVKTQIFQDAALGKYLEDYDTKARGELSKDDFWMNTLPVPGIFRTQSLLGSGPAADARKEAWNRYWAQVDKFNPDLPITVPIRISQAGGDERVRPGNTEQLLGQLSEFADEGPITSVFYYPPGTAPGKQFDPPVHHTEIQKTLAVPDPAELGEHFGLLVDDTEIEQLVDWARRAVLKHPASNPGRR